MATMENALWPALASRARSMRCRSANPPTKCRQDQASSHSARKTIGERSVLPFYSSWNNPNRELLHRNSLQFSGQVQITTATNLHFPFPIIKSRLLNRNDMVSLGQLYLRRSIANKTPVHLDICTRRIRFDLELGRRRVCAGSVAGCLLDRRSGLKSRKL